MKKINKLLGLSLATGMLFAPPTLAGDAVSSINFKVDGYYGNVDSEESHGGNASITFPLGSKFGLQLDGMVGEIKPDDIHGGGLHAFWRDSEVALLGITASTTELDQTENHRVGIEGEYYLGKFTIYATGGYQSGDVEDDAYGGMDIKFYLLEDLMLSAGVVSTDSNQIYAGIIEYQTPLNGLSIFCNAATGDEDYEHVYGGVRFYFGGGQKSLMKHHREDDPSNNLMNHTLETLVIRKAEAAAAVVVNSPQSGGFGGGGGN